MKPINPSREYNLYLANYRAYLAKKSIKKIIDESEAIIPSSILWELMQVCDKLTPLHEIEK